MDAESAKVVPIEQMSKELGIGRSLAYDLARRNELPVPVIKLGRRMVVSRAALDAVLNARREPVNA